MHAMYKDYPRMCTVQHDSEIYTYVYTYIHLYNHVHMHGVITCSQRFNRC